MLRHAFTDVHEVLFSVAERNLRSRRAVEKLGAELAGAGDTPRWGQIHVIYRLTPQLWAQRAAPGYGPALREVDVDPDEKPAMPQELKV